MSIKNLNQKRLTSGLQQLKKDKRQFDDQYESILSVENFNNTINIVIIEENIKVLKKVSRKHKIPLDDLIKLALPSKNEEIISSLRDVDENETFEPLKSDEEKTPVYNKVLVGKKYFFENERDNDTNLYDESMNIVGEIKMKKEYNIFKAGKKQS